MNRTNPENLDSTVIHFAIWRWAQQTPDAIAIRDQGQEYSYRELAKRVDALARRLVQAGVGRDVLVGISIERSADLIIGALAILRAGGAYVPIDPAYPADRRDFLISDSQCVVLLTQSRLLPLYQGSQARVLLVDPEPASVVETAAADRETQPALPEPTLADDSLAYVIYTSGSTGKPKGVCVTHHNLLRLFRQTEAWYHFGPQDRIPLFHSFSFDYSVWEMWSALLYGGCLVIVPLAVVRDPIAFHQLVSREGITVLNQTPSEWQLFVRADQLAQESAPAGLDITLPALRYVMLGGEALDLRRLQPWFDRHGDQHPQLVNLYGITETTVIITARPLSLRDQQDSRSLIGVAIPDLTLHILDPAGQPVADGQEGELWVGGQGVARGYLRRPELTEARFRPDPFSRDAQARLYRTGDLVRRGADGELEYLGRIDLQVKLGGHRIELGEIEAVLREDPAVADVAVLARQIQQGPPQLVAYVVARTGAALDVNALREHVRLRLPEYMCPATWMTLAQLPLTVNGKLDRDALPVPLPLPMPLALQNQASDAQPTHFAPDTEQVIARLFQEALGRPLLKPTDDFFASGGTSLAAMQLSLRIAETLGVMLPTGGIFRCPTVAALAAEIDRARAQASAPADPSEGQQAATHESDWHPLSPMQEQIWFVQNLAPGSTAFHCPAAFQIAGALDVPRLTAALERAATRHPLLRAQFSVVHGRPMQRIAANPTWHVQVGELCEGENTPQAALQLPIVQDFLRRPFDLSQSAAAALLLQVDRQRFLFLLLVHHIVTDGWSVEQLLRELSADYQGAPIPAPRQTFFQCVAQRDSQRSPAARKDSEAYFTSQLADAPATSEILGDFPRPTTASLRGRLHPFSLPAATRTALVQLAHQEGVSPNILLFAALFALLHRYTGQKDLVIGLPYAGRDLPGSEAVQGPLLSLLPVRVQLAAGISFRSLLRLVRAQTHAAYCHSVVPFSQVRALLKLQHETARHPLFQVSYAPQPGRRGHLALADLQVVPLFVDPGKSQYDLTLYAWPAQDDLPLELEYASDLYSDATIRQLVTHYQQLLDAGLQQADAPLAQLPMLTSEERSTLLAQWSGTDALPAADDEAESVLSRFRHQVRAQPDATAVRYGEENISYRQLDSWSDRIAWALHEQQLPRDSCVALACPRSPDAIAGILGAWKAGIAYVPLDPAYPESRLLWMLQDSGAALVLTTHEAGGLRTPNHRHLYIDDQRPRPDAAQAPASEAAALVSAPPSVVDSTHAAPALPDPNARTLAYVIYTSGSTGLPKGVLIEHRSLAALAAVIPRFFPLAPGERLLQFASLSFDWSVADLLIALTQGGTLVLPTARFGLAGRELVDLLARERITQVLLPPSVLSQLPDHPLPDLRLLLSGGERCPASIVKRWSQGRIFRNAYGPTEATIVATVHDCHPDERDPAIGRPLPGAIVYVLDADGQQVPPLVPGELYIGGRGLARGYHARPELSAARFPENLPAVAGRLYRSGDIVRFRRDGSLEFLGRKDDQRKLRGFRIELGEIEAALRGAPGVQAAVAWIDGEGASARLLGYVVRSAIATASATTAVIPPESEFLAELRVRLRSQLPPQLVPSDLIVLDALPLTPNGKLNPAALPRVAVDQATAAAALNEWEALVAEVWQSVLGRAVPRTANFFDVGGSSLRLIEVQALLETRLGTRVALADLFAHPTIEAMGALISRGRSRGQDMQRQSQERAQRAAQHRPQGRPGR